jgi:hypothetical protein
MTTDEIMKLADEFAEMYANQLGGSAFTGKRNELKEAISKLRHDKANHQCASTLMEAAYDALQAKYDALLEKTKDGNFLGVFQDGELKA